MLPATTQFEKFEATFFNFEYPKNVLPPAPAGARPAGRSAARAGDPRPAGRCARPARRRGRRARCALRPRRAASEFAARVRRGDRRRPAARLRSRRSLLYRTLGPTLPHGAAAAAALWPMAMRCAQVNPDGVARAGFGDGPDAGDRLFDAIVDSPSGVVFTDDTWEATLAAPQDRATASSTSTSPSCSTSWPSSPTRRRPAATPSGR